VQTKAINFGSPLSINIQKNSLEIKKNEALFFRTLIYKKDRKNFDIKISPNDI
jgi:hypothetical protein